MSFGFHFLLILLNDSLKKSIVMILILVIIIFSLQNSPQNRHVIFTSNKPLTIIKLSRIKRKRKRNNSDCNNPFPPPPLTHSFFPTISSFISLFPNSRLWKYVHIFEDASQYIRKRTHIYIYIYIYIYTCGQRHIHTSIR